MEAPKNDSMIDAALEEIDALIPIEEIGITFKAHFAKLTTLADGSIRLALDLSPIEFMEAAKVVTMQGRTFQVALVPEPKQASSRGPW